MRKVGFFIGLLGMSFLVKGQDMHFTQAMQNPMLINPAATGMFEGWERFSVTHKNQWVNAGTNWYTTCLSAEMNFFKPKRGNAAHLGLGILFYNDVGGDSKFGTKQGTLTLTGIVPVAEMHTLSAGLQFGMGQRSGDLSKLVFGNQFNGSELDPSMSSGEVNNLVSFMYADFSTGIQYQFGGHNIGFHKDHLTDFRVGLAYFHFNKPSLSYRLGFTEDMYSKVVFSTSLVKDFSGKVGIETYFNQFFQGPHRESSLGFLLRYHISSGSKITGLTKDKYLAMGAALRYKDAFSPIVRLHWDSFTFGISYDVTVAELGRVSRGGGLEFSLVYSNLDHALFKNRRN